MNRTTPLRLYDDGPAASRPLTPRRIALRALRPLGFVARVAVLLAATLLVFAWSVLDGLLAAAAHESPGRSPGVPDRLFDWARWLVFGGMPPHGSAGFWGWLWWVATGSSSGETHVVVRHGSRTLEDHRR